ncbi:ketosynthase chain-length factor [Nocardia halotolerans]|uniref:Ketosynthase chain-length factor n=1 Tax=Nocardia halotolerans TaxID=1755878 RepID=A0ABV8VEZ5_9NOCA
MTTAVVTGFGVVAPNGLGTEDFWDATVAGKSAIDRVTRFDPSRYPAQLAGEVPGFVAVDHLPGRLLPQTDRMTQLALSATDWALADAGIAPSEVPAFDMGVITASSSGGFEFGQRELANLWSRGGRHVSAYQSFAWFYAVNSGQIAIRHGMKGPAGVLVSDQAGGLDAGAQARRAIRRGTETIVTGAVDSSMCSWGWVGQQASGRLSTSEEPSAAYLPFDVRANGHVPGEGGAILIVESAARAARRGASPYGTIAGYGATFDLADGATAPGLHKAIEIALADARLTPGDIDVVFADAAGISALDRIEAQAISKIFGKRAVPVTAPKTMTGRLYSGAGPLDLVTALLAMRHELIPPTVNIEPDPELGLDLVVAHPRPASIGAALILARGQGGFNSALVVTNAQS